MREQPRKHKSMRRTPWDESKELTPVQRFIKSSYLENYGEKHPALSSSDEVELLNSLELTTGRYCESTFIRKYGYTKTVCSDTNAENAEEVLQ